VRFYIKMYLLFNTIIQLYQLYSSIYYLLFIYIELHMSLFTPTGSGFNKDVSSSNSDEMTMQL